MEVLELRALFGLRLMDKDGFGLDPLLRLGPERFTILLKMVSYKVWREAEDQLEDQLAYTHRNTQPANRTPVGLLRWAGKSGSTIQPQQ